VLDVAGAFKPRDAFELFGTEYVMNLNTALKRGLAAALVASASLAAASSIYNPDNPDWTTFNSSRAPAAGQVGASSAPFTGVFPDGVERVIELKDGSAVYVFPNGRMGMESSYGHPSRMKSGEVMHTRDGQELIMIGDEVSRVESLKGKEITR